MTGELQSIALIAAERTRQIEVEGYDANHDEGHADELVLAAKAYLTLDPRDWPWDAASFKPNRDVQRNRVRAAALIAAAIDSDIERSERWLRGPRLAERNPR